MAWTPVSRMATTPEPPFESDHASRTRIRSSEYWPAVFGSLTGPRRRCPRLGQLDHVIGVGVRDSRISAQLGDDILDRSPGGRQDGWLALARAPSSATRPARARVATRALAALAPLHDDLAGHDLAASGVVVGARDRRRPPAAAVMMRAEGGEKGREGSWHAGWAPVWSDEKSGQETRQPARCPHPTGEGLPPNTGRWSRGRVGPMDGSVRRQRSASSSSSRGVAAATARSAMADPVLFAARAAPRSSRRSAAGRPGRIRSRRLRARSARPIPRRRR